MVIHRTPLYGIVCLKSIGLRTVMVVKLEDVVQAEGHHIVDAGLTRTFHQRGHGEHKVLVSGKGLL